MAEQKFNGRFVKGGTIKLEHLGSDVVDGNGKILVGALPAAVFGGMSYKGSWNAATNSPAIPAASEENKGWYYIVGTSGTTDIDGVADWTASDWIVSNGTAWTKSDNSENTELASTTAFDPAGTTLVGTNVQTALVEVVNQYGGAQAMADYARSLAAVLDFGDVQFAAANAPELGLRVAGNVVDGYTAVAGDKVLMLDTGDIYAIQSSGAPLMYLAMATGIRSVNVLYGGSQSGRHLYQRDGANNTTHFLHAVSDAAGITYRDSIGAEFGTVEAKLLEMGVLSALTTAEKSTLVGAVSEVRDDLNSLVSDRWIDETPAGAVDGVNTVFTTTYAPATGTVPRLEIDGFRQRIPNNATWDGGNHTFTFVTPPQPGEWVNVSYFKTV